MKNLKVSHLPRLINSKYEKGGRMKRRGKKIKGEPQFKKPVS